MINPPAANKYCYWTNPKTPDNPEDWRAGAKANEGSWWRDWDTWIKKISSGDRVPAREPGGRKLKPLCDAPGNVRDRAGLRDGEQPECSAPGSRRSKGGGGRDRGTVCCRYRPCDGLPA